MVCKQIFPILEVQWYKVYILPATLQYYKYANIQCVYNAEPLPVPLLLVGHDLDWMTVSPFALNFWEKLYLEPFAGATNIAYIVVCPDVENVLQAAKSFFYELSSLYEVSSDQRHTYLSFCFTFNLEYCIALSTISYFSIVDWVTTNHTCVSCKIRAC